MSAQVGLLREAAARMRHRAEAANTDDERRPYGNDTVDPVPESQWGALVENYLGGAIGVHCASWTPTAAVAVAELLEKAADGYKTEWDTPECPNCGEGCAGHDRAEYHADGCEDWVDDCQCLEPFLKVAREFLRREAVEADA